MAAYSDSDTLDCNGNARRSSIYDHGCRNARTATANIPLSCVGVAFGGGPSSGSLRRISVDKCYEFWESEVKSHLLSPRGKVDRSKLLDEYGYVASEWSENI